MNITDCIRTVNYKTIWNSLLSLIKYRTKFKAVKNKVCVEEAGGKKMAKERNEVGLLINVLIFSAGEELKNNRMENVRDIKTELRELYKKYNELWIE
jgi:hypothetical protein